MASGERAGRAPRGKATRERMDNDARRAQLLALGLEVFATHAYDEVSIEDLAERAGISKGLLYHYFPTKRDYYAATVREAARQLLSLTDLPDSIAPAERLHEGLARYLRFVERHASAYSTLLRGGIGSDPEVAAVIEETRQALLARIVRGLGEVDPTLRLTLRGWIGFVEATSLEWLDRRELDRDEMLALWIAALLRLTPGLAERVAASAG
ncbi:MAG: helix-turn-helix domain-containing protein [Polyangiales bacterium]